jgi:hypothetical protein
MVWLLRHRQTKGPATDRPHLHHRATSRLHTSSETAKIQLSGKAGGLNGSTQHSARTHLVFTNEGRKLSKKVERALPCVSLMLANQRTTGPVN